MRTIAGLLVVFFVFSCVNYGIVAFGKWLHSNTRVEARAQ